MNDLSFDDAAPVRRPFSGGKQAEPNPYTDVIAAIALKTYPEGTVIEGKNVAGEPVAKSFVITHENEENVKTDCEREARRLRAAGKKNDPVVTVRVVPQDKNITVQSGPNKGKVKEFKSRILFWTVKEYVSKKNKNADASKDETPKNDDAQLNNGVTTDVKDAGPHNADGSFAAA